MTIPTYDVFDPATLERVGSAPEHTQADVERAIASATSASRAWAADRTARKANLKQTAGLIRTRAAELGSILSREQGKPLREAVTEFLVAADLFDYYANLAWDETESLPDRAGRQVQVHHRPVGLVGTITPWNFPISLLAVKLAPALAAGCTVIAKPSPTTPLSTIALIELLNEVLPANVAQVRTSSRRTVNVALSSLPGVRKISFTGSTDVGISVATQALQGVKRVTLELGGNDPAIVLPDADIRTTARGIVASAFRNAGQVCMAVKRVYVPRELAGELTEAISAEVSAHVIGHGINDSTTMGPMHNAAQLATVQAMIAQATAAGATIAHGNERGTKLPGHFLAPTVIANATDGMSIVDEEQFGNALPIVSYSDENALIQMLNGQEFGLGSSLWTPDEDRAQQLAATLETGTVWINQHTVVELDAPFGGWKASGVGRERGRYGLDEYLETRTINARAHA
ncbi:aldehyde dehydrogenase [Arthrobacter sp. MYb227]|uniref:aldehyde dehydrogenase family protein n=1 Tax=Arthrobacter sp. MYb227 TaxID=1848601 RepID=UPI000CFBF81F|nr:aldehyde dehydrogenase family protein [Arthrobacter sp. MYb227]PQZ94657.1 aldehyde dehydrogenase [Arthrobacter sp. MYb227]